MIPKFSDCETCIFFSRKRTNPACRQCDSGEFYEEKVRTREKTDDELMSLYGEFSDDDE